MLSRFRIAVVLLLAACGPFSGSSFEPWVDAGAAPISPNVVGFYRGPGHCEWQSAVFLQLGWPLGSPISPPDDYRLFVRDPEGIFGPETDMQPLAMLDLDASLPGGAEDSGWRSGEIGLWFDPADDTVAYLVLPDHVERWPRLEPIYLCA